jgi:phytoene dehydrogenase-like protein
MSYDAIIIGAGINGLVAATVLARKGRKVALVDRRETVGGMATLAQGDGPALAHLLYNLSPAVRRDLGIDGAQWPFKAEPLATVALCPHGDHIVIEGHTARFASGAVHPDAAAYARMLKQLTGYADLLRGLAEGPPPGGGLSAQALLRYARFGIGVRRLGRREMRKFMQHLLSNAADLILDEMGDGPLAGCLAADAVRGAAVGPKQPGTVMSLVYRLGHGGAAMRPQEGMQTVFDTLSRQAEKAGVTLHLGKAVSRIEIADDAVRAVVTSDGERWETRRILSSIALPALLPLTGHAPFDIETTSRIRTTRARGTAAKVNLRLKDPLDINGLTAAQTDARLIFAPSVAYVDRAANAVKYCEMTQTPVIEAVPFGDWLSCIVQFAPSDLAGGWTDEARARLVQQTIETLAKVAPRLTDQIAETQVMTPDQIAAETAAPGGHWHHAEMALDQLLTLRPGNGIAHYSLGPKGLYLCGASAHPGGDIMGLAGRNAALKALEDMG